MKYFSLLLLVTIGLFSCTAEQSQAPVQEQTYPEIFNQVLEAHGGKATWDAMNTLMYTRGTGPKAEQHTIDLKTRKSIIEVNDKYQLGFDGENVWVAPHRDSFPGSSPRFTHNLHFYFVAIPFVFTDPGVRLKDGGLVESGDQQYHVIHATFGENVGDAPEDRYNMYIDPTTKRVSFITYSVTYFDPSRATQYNALKYDWVDANGLLAPEQYIGYKWENEALGEKRYESSFSNLRYEKTAKEHSTYAPPSGAYIDLPAQKEE